METLGQPCRDPGLGRSRGFVAARLSSWLRGNPVLILRSLRPVRLSCTKNILLSLFISRQLG